MNNSIWQSIASTPWWYAVIFIWAAYVSRLSTKPSTIPLIRFYTATLFFLLVAAIAIFSLLHPTLAHYAVFAVMAVLGGGLGWLRFSMLSVRAIPDKNMLTLPGTWTLALTFIVSFIAIFFFGWTPQFNASYFHSHAFNLHAMMMYGFLSGFFIGRTAHASHIAKYGPFIELPKTDPISPAH